MPHRRHPRAKLTVEGRRLLVHRVRRLGWPAVRAAEAQGVARATAYKWLARFDAEGEAGLVDRSSRPGSCPHRLSAEREQAILSHRRQQLEGPHRIAWALGEARSTVHRVLRRYGEPRLADLDRASRTVVRYQRDRPGELLHVDVKKLGRIPDGGGHRVHGRYPGHTRGRGIGYDYLHVAVDDRTRLAYVEVHPDEKADTCGAFLVRARGWFAQHGVRIERVMTDNAFAYRHGRAFQAALRQMHARHLRIRPHRPCTNGKAERFNQTLLREWGYATTYTSNNARLATLTDWLHRYNTHRPHAGLHGATPMQTLRQLVNDLPEHNT